MAAAGRPTENAPSPSDIAGRLRDAAFVRLVAAADGDSLAAAGVLADGLQQEGVPFQLTVTRPDARADRTTDADCTVAIGGPAIVADIDIDGGGDPASRTAYEVVRELDGPAADPMLTLAGVHAAGETPGELTDVAGLEREPGVAVPTADLADGLAHSMLFVAPFSGDIEAAQAALSTVDTDEEDAGRAVASLLALRVLGEERATPRAAEAIERALRPYVGGPFETIGGYADVLDATAREAPGIAAALVLGQSVEAQVLDAWRTHAERAHAALEAATTGRYDGLFVVRDDGDVPTATVAALCRDYRSPEPVVLVLTDGRATAAGTPDADVDLAAVFDDAFGEDVVVATPTRATVTLAESTADAIVAVREAMDV